MNGQIHFKQIIVIVLHVIYTNSTGYLPKIYSVASKSPHDPLIRGKLLI